MGGAAVSLLAEARAAGLEVRAEADRLVVRGPRSGAALAERLLEQKAEVLDLLSDEDAEVAWRVAAMRPRVPTTGPILILVVRETTLGPGRCVSCGDALGPDRPYRCAPCSVATRLVLDDVREAAQR